ASILGACRIRKNKMKVGLQAEVTIRKCDFIALEILEVAAFVRAGFEPAVEGIAQRVEPRLRILEAEAGEEFFDNVRFAVAVGVFGVDQIGRGGNEDTFSP